MNIAQSLHASAQVFEHIGHHSTADICLRMMRDCASMDEIFGEGAGSALHRHAASELAERAAVKLQAFNQRKAAA